MALALGLHALALAPRAPRSDAPTCREGISEGFHDHENIMGTLATVGNGWQSELPEFPRTTLRARRTRVFLLAPRGIAKPQPPAWQKAVKVWDQIQAFFFDQSHIGPFLFENWMVVFGTPSVHLVPVGITEGNAFVGRLRGGLGRPPRTLLSSPNARRPAASWPRIGALAAPAWKLVAWRLSRSPGSVRPMAQHTTPLCAPD